ncbi:MAG: hypothetical protein GYA02_16390 [Clostridiaceae bacterium]|nr:hypothetical protein [Clostridiaceae bacterium]
MSKFYEKSKNKVQINNKANNQKEEVNERELEISELDEVAGGISLRDVDKVDTTDISDSTKSKI